MAIGFSDGTSYEDMHDYYLGQPHSKLQAPDVTASNTDEGQDPQESFGRRVRQIKTNTPSPERPASDPEKPTGEFKSPGGTQVAESWSTNPKGWDEGNWNDSWELMEPYGGAGGNPQSRDQLIKKHPDMEFLDDPYDRYDSPSPGGSMYFRKPPNKAPETSQIDRDHNVPLIASALTKDGSTMHGMAVDHRVNLAMNFEGKDHDITPFLWAHEQAELGPMAAAVKGGMDAKDAYELAHDKVANPAEAAVRNAYAIKAGLDVDKFNESYHNHIKQQGEVAKQLSNLPRHEDAHTTTYGLDDHYAPDSVEHEPYVRLAMDMEDTPGYLLRHGGQNDFGGMGSSPKPRIEKQVETPFGTRGPKDTTYVHYKAMHPETGEELGHVRFTVQGEKAYLSSTRGPGSSNSIGPSNVRAVFRKFTEDFPEVKEVSAERVNGARANSGSGARSVKFDVKDGRLVLRDQSAGRPMRYNRRPPRNERPEETPDRPFMEIDQPNEPSWQDQPLRNRQGRMISRDAPMSETGPASFRNALRSLDIPTNRYPSEYRSPSISDWLRDNPQVIRDPEWMKK